MPPIESVAKPPEQTSLPETTNAQAAEKAGKDKGKSQVPPNLAGKPAAASDAVSSAAAQVGALASGTKVTAGDDAPSAADQEAELQRMLEEEADLERRSKIAKDTRDLAARLALRRREVEEEERAAASAQSEANKPVPVTPAMTALAASQAEVKAELDRTARVGREAAQAQAQAEENERILQSKHTDGELDHKKIEEAGKTAADRVRLRALKGQPAGVFVLSGNLLMMGPGGVRTDLPIGTRLLPHFLSQMTEEDIKKHCDEGTLEDLR